MTWETGGGGLPILPTPTSSDSQCLVPNIYSLKFNSLIEDFDT